MAKKPRSSNTEVRRVTDADILDRLESIDAKLTNILGILSDTRKPDELEASAVLAKSALSQLFGRRGNERVRG